MGVIAIIAVLGMGIYGGAVIEDKHNAIPAPKAEKQHVVTTYNYNK